MLQVLDRFSFRIPWRARVVEGFKAEAAQMSDMARAHMHMGTPSRRNRACHGIHGASIDAPKPCQALNKRDQCTHTDPGSASYAGVKKKIEKARTVTPPPLHLH